MIWIIIYFRDKNEKYLKYIVSNDCCLLSILFLLILFLTKYTVTHPYTQIQKYPQGSYYRKSL